LLAVSVASCAHKEKQEAAPPPAPPPAPAAKATPPAATQQLAPPADLNQAKTQLETAHQDVATAQQQLADAQRREEQARTNVQQYEIQARQELERASALAAEAEQAQGLRAATGRIQQATPSRVTLQTNEGKTMSFHVDDRTKVLVGAEQRSISQVQQGADARVSYDPKGDEPTAVTIRLAPARTQTP
jgi:hypothetical protein